MSKRRRAGVSIGDELQATRTAMALSAAAAESTDEPIVRFNGQHYQGGLNANFEREDAVAFFAGGDGGGGGMFEDPEKRDIVKAKTELLDVLRCNGIMISSLAHRCERTL